jgi:HPt (histidine-containing phosphotransfer) domain-containing protein
MIEQLRSALTVGDLERIGRVAHRLTGSCAQIGATAMADRSRSIESMVAAGDGAGVASSVAFLESDWRSTAGEFEDWRRDTGALGSLRNPAEGLQ